MKAHIPDGFADVVVADVPYWLSRYSTQVVDYYLDTFGMKPRLAEEWDKFDSLEEYERQAEQWLEQIMRSLKHDGSAFIFGIYTNIGLINRICQKKGYFIVNEIAWTVRNSRPTSGRMLQGSHQNILWIAKTEGDYRFRYGECKDAHYPGDYFSKAGMQMRDTWDIVVAPHENKYGHPTPKPLALYCRILDVAGKSGGMLLEPFAGSGPGAIAAMRWGMHSFSIEQRPDYCDMIRQRILDEWQRPDDAPDEDGTEVIYNSEDDTGSDDDPPQYLASSTGVESAACSRIAYSRVAFCQVRSVPIPAPCRFRCSGDGGLAL